MKIDSAYPHLELGERSQGVVQLRHVIRQYPNSDEANLARQRLREFGDTQSLCLGEQRGHNPRQRRVVRIEPERAGSQVDDSRRQMRELVNRRCRLHAGMTDRGEVREAQQDDADAVKPGRTQNTAGHRRSGAGWTGRNRNSQESAEIAEE